MERRPAVTYRWVSSKSTHVSFPPSFDADPAVDGTISPPSGSTVRDTPGCSPGTWESGPSVRFR
jgi:hypothetical protein